MLNLKVVFTAPWTVELQEEPVREPLAPDEVLIETLYSVISPGTELACLAGIESWFAFPRSPGYSQTGRVVAVGANVQRVRPGHVIVNFGAHQKYNIIRDHAGTLLLPVPTDMESDSRLAFTRMATVAFTGVRASSIELGDAVAVTGLGLVGNLAAQLAALQGAFVTAVDILPHRIDVARQCGIQKVVNSTTSDVAKTIREGNGGEGVRTVIEATGNPNVAAKSLDWIAQGGELVLLGSPRGDCQGDITDLLNHIHIWGRGSVTITGAHEWRYPVVRNQHVKHSMERNARIVWQLLREDRLRLNELVTHRATPAQAPTIYEGLRQQPDAYLGALIDWT